MGDWAAALQGLGAGMQGQGAQWAAAQEMQKRTQIDQEKLRREAFIQEGLMAESMLRNGRPDQALELFRSRVEAGSKLPPMQSLGGNFDASSHVLQMLEKGDAAGALAELSAGNQILRDAGIIQNQNAAYQFGASSMGKDEAGNLFQISQSRNPNTGKVETVMSPVGHSSPQQGQISIVGTMGMTAPESIQYSGAETAAQQAARLGYAGPIAGAQAGAKAAVEQATAPATAAAVATATGAAERSNASAARTVKATQLYQPFATQLQGVRDAFAGTGTGPLVGQFKGLTASSQKAQAAAKILEPLLKGVVRDAGEGTFTEGDRAQIQDMMPKETDYPDVVVFKTEWLDKFVRGKLGVPESGGQGGTPATPQGPATQKTGGTLHIDANGNKAMVYPDGTFEEVP